MLSTMTSLKLPRHLRRGRRVVTDTPPFTAAALDYVHNLLCGTSLLQVTRKMDLSEVDLLLELGERARAETSRRRRAPGSVAASAPDGEPLSGVQLRAALVSHVRANRGEPRTPAPASEPTRAGLEVLAELAGLSAADRSVLQFLAALQLDRLRGVVDLFGDVTLAEAAAIIAAATALPRVAVTETLKPGGRLRATGLLTIDADVVSLSQKLDLNGELVDLIGLPSLDRQQVLSRFLTEMPPPSLASEDFAHLAENVAVCRRLLEAAVRAGRPGVNLLFHGPTGTGKTELARLLAHDLGVPLYGVGTSDPGGGSATASERLSSLRLAHQLVGKTPALLLFDELEDLFKWDIAEMFGGRKATAHMSKAWFNDVLESNPTPTLWITNVTAGIDPAFLRRMTFAVELRPLGRHQRTRVLRRHLDDHSELSDGDIEAVADRFAASPAQLGSAVAAARLLAPDLRPTRAALEQVLAPVEALVSGKAAARAPRFDVATFRLDALHASADLAALAERLASSSPGQGPGISLCLHGPPGTGKTEYVRYLAHRMGRPILVRRASDLESPWVGEMEKNLAGAFRQAAEDNAVLLFDEVDSFLWDRAGAQRAWEVSRVNELLQQLETFRGVVACTTNLWRAIDEAALRRFVFKLEFRFLRTDQALALLRATFERHFGATITPTDEAHARAELGRLTNLAPGDFAAVLRQVKAMDSPPRVVELVALLVGEARAKRSARRAIGF